jgi:hypothetical protein
MDSLPRRPRLKIILPNAKHEVDATLGGGKILWLLVFLVFGVYTSTLARYQLDERAVARDLDVDIQCERASGVLLSALLIDGG